MEFHKQQEVRRLYPKSSAKMVALTSVSNPRSNRLKRLILSSTKGVHIIPFKEITRLQADNNYCLVFLENGKQILVSKTLKYLATNLPADQFIKTHQSHLVRIDLIRHIESAMLTLKDGSIIPISRSRKGTILNHFN